MRMMPSELLDAGQMASAFARDATAFFCSQSCPGDIILTKQDWANARDPDRVSVIGGFRTLVKRDVPHIPLRSKWLQLKGKKPEIR